MQLPIRVDIATGERLPPSGIDPYSLPWAQGAAATVHRRTREKYASQISDLREKLDLLASKRGKADGPMFRGEIVPTYGPRLRPWYYHKFDQSPPSATGRPATEDERE